MITIKIDAEYTPEFREFVMKLFGRYNVVSFTVGEEEPPSSDLKVRSGATGNDLSTAISAAVDKAQRDKSTI